MFTKTLLIARQTCNKPTAQAYQSLWAGRAGPSSWSAPGPTAHAQRLPRGAAERLLVCGESVSAAAAGVGWAFTRHGGFWRVLNRRTAELGAPAQRGGRGGPGTRRRGSSTPVAPVESGDPGCSRP